MKTLDKVVLLGMDSWNHSESRDLNKNSAEVDIAPASGKITKNVKYRSRAPGSGVF